MPVVPSVCAHLATNQEIMPLELLLHTLAATLISTTVSFHVPPANLPRLRRAPISSFAKLTPPTASDRLAALRGGGPIEMSLASALGGSLAVPTCWGLATAACSLAFIRQAYVFSLSYGLSMALIGLAILTSIPASAPAVLTYHAYLVVAYGVRLFAFLYWRQSLQDSGWAQKLDALQDASLEALPSYFDGSVLCSWHAPALPSPICEWHGFPGGLPRWLCRRRLWARRRNGRRSQQVHVQDARARAELLIVLRHPA